MSSWILVTSCRNGFEEPGADEGVAAFESAGSGGGGASDIVFVFTVF